MVPGMTERERLAADVRRLDWLAEARLGPAHVSHAPDMNPVSGLQRPGVPVGLWRRGPSSARMLGQRIRLRHPAAGVPLPDRASALVR